MRWSWDGVDFEVLAPAKHAMGSENDLSCVLKVSSPFGRALLPGDIEFDGEAWLIQTDRDALAANILIAPHHGSSTSSSPDFVAAVSPDYVVFTAGFHNRFNFPHPEPLHRYAEAGAKSFISSEHGALRFDVLESELTVTAERRAPIHWYSDQGAEQSPEQAQP